MIKTLIFFFFILTNAFGEENCHHIADSTDWKKLKKIEITNAVYFSDAAIDTIPEKTAIFNVNISRLKNAIKNPSFVTYKDSCNILSLPLYGCMGFGGYLLINEKMQIYSPCGACACGGNSFTLQFKDFDIGIPRSVLDTISNDTIKIDLFTAIKKYQK